MKPFRIMQQFLKEHDRRITQAYIATQIHNYIMNHSPLYVRMLPCLRKSLC